MKKTKIPPTNQLQPAETIDVTAYMGAHKELIDGYLERCLPSAEVYPEVIHEAMRYSVFAGGKRLRPILALATGETLDGPFARLAPLACALELIHCYSLIHDDLPAMDNDDYRRGQPTSHKKFGEGVAILAGDGLLTLAFQILAEIPMPSELAEIKVKVIHKIAKAIGTSCGMIGGQVLDLITQGKSFTREQLNFIHSSKTGALIQASIVSAALLCEAKPEVREALGRFGARIGLAFQVVDDILDVEEPTERLGKTQGKDQAGGKATYPALYGVEKSRDIAGQLIEDAIHEIAFLGPKGAMLRELALFISVRRF